MTARAPLRVALNLAIDGAMGALAVPVARAIAAPGEAWLNPPWLLAIGALTLLLAGLPFRLPWQYWRFAGISDLLSVSGASVLGAVLFAAAAAFTGTASANFAFPAVHALVLLVLLGTPRVAYRLLRQQRRAPLPESMAPGRPSALVVGATEDLDLFLRALDWDRRQTLRVEGLLAAGARQTGRRIHGYPFLGAISDVGAVLEKLDTEGHMPDMLVVATPDLSGQSLAVLVEQADRFGLQLRRAPRPTALDTATERSDKLELRPMAIEDLLNRAQVPLDREGMARLIQGRRVIVTGAGGTIGSELARQVAALGPERLILVDNGEYALWLIDLELAERHPHVPRESLLADIRDEGRIRAVFEQWRPELVFHAAALKHVPMVEANPLEGLLTNVAGTRHVADAARAVGSLAMVLISTDKA
ncbi:MAG TPA: polysaccharide biosynthesis protein, partial [Sphingomonas sp.]|nr:polysaccharide biosynthesis protein [Sphingomonas sp.]